jgi:DNA-binding response OmpR family regulator
LDFHRVEVAKFKIMKILLVEDEIRLAETLAEVLTDHYYAVDIAPDGEEAWNYIKTYSYDSILLDIMLPKLDGISLCQRLRSHGYQLPVLMLTARDASEDVITGLDAGADDYVIKPVVFSELLARLRALLRRGKTSGPPVLEWEGLCLNPSTYEVTYRERPIKLVPKEYAILELFIRNGRRVFSRALLIQHVWASDDSPEEETVKGYIKSLRQKLRAAGAPADFIETVHSLGYRLK